MKTTILTILLSLMLGMGYAQVPEAINYQAVYRNSAGDIQPNANIIVRFTILEGTLPGTQVYQETHNAATNNLGLFTLEIGRGLTVGNDSFDSIDWTGGLMFIDVELGNIGGSFTSIGITQLLTVPYSFYANTAGKAINTRVGDLVDVQGGTVQTGQVLRWNGFSWAYSDDEVNDADSDPSNEIQALSINGADLSLSNGGGTASIPNNSALWNADRLQGNAVSSQAPQVGQILRWDGTSWKPEEDSSSGEAKRIKSLLYTIDGF
ncbi:MAG: hypothetical protein AAFW00_07250 [Bacteroidota bacterium]